MTTLTAEARIRDFADGRRGWCVVEGYVPNPESTFAYRTFLQAPMLLVHTHNLIRYPWGADVTWGTATDSMEKIRGTLDEVEDWVSAWEKILALPARLAECRTRRAARSLTAQVPQSHITKLSRVLDDDVLYDQDSLVNRYGPARKGIFG